MKLISPVEMAKVSSLRPDDSNPRKPDQARMALLRLSIQKLGFIMPLLATADGLVLSGHQRLTVAKSLGIPKVPVIRVPVKNSDIKGINILCNRATNDFSAFDTGQKVGDRLHYSDVIVAAESLPDFSGEFYAASCMDRPVSEIPVYDHSKYDKKAALVAANMARKGVRIPIVLSESGKVVNGIHRLFSAKETSEKSWPVITVPDAIAEVASAFLNYLSMDFHVDEDFADLLRYSAYRRPQNNRGAVPKAYRFWANGNRTLPDSSSYTTRYWQEFRDFHGLSVLDFGAGLGKVAPFLRSKGIDCIDFEPYRIDPSCDSGTPCPAYSKQEASRFLDEIATGKQFTSIFLASVLNSIPFPQDRMAVLAVVHALASKDTKVYGTCRDISDFNYEYGGIRNASYFVFDSEPGVRVGDVMRNPKIQKFHTQSEADAMFSRLWTQREYWPGGNVFYFMLGGPKQINSKVLTKALEMEFELMPYADGSRMGLGKKALGAFSKRLGVKLG